MPTSLKHVLCSLASRNSDAHNSLPATQHTVDDATSVSQRHQSALHDPSSSTSSKQHYTEVLQELTATQRSKLKSPPVFYVNRVAEGFLAPTHGYVVVGNPDKGRKSGAVLYSIMGDPKRGPVAVTKKLLAKIYLQTHSCTSRSDEQHIRKTLLALLGQHFPSREAFYLAYQRARGTNVDPEIVTKEVARIFRMLPSSSMELWPNRANGYANKKPNFAERDVRAFEAIPRDIRYSLKLRQLHQLKSEDMLAATQQMKLHQLYLDEKLGRSGIGMPDPESPPTADAVTQHALAHRTPRYQLAPPFGNHERGNCNSGTASLVRAATHQSSEPATTKFRAASIFAIGAHHTVSLWHPTHQKNTKRNQTDQE